MGPLRRPTLEVSHTIFVFIFLKWPTIKRLVCGCLLKDARITIKLPPEERGYDK